MPSTTRTQNAPATSGTTQLCSDINRRLDELEGSLPPIPAKIVSLNRAVAGRFQAIASGVADNVGRELRRVGDRAGTAASTTGGQARQAAGRTVETARRSVEEAAGQARDAFERTAETAQRSAKQAAGQAREAAERTANTATGAAKQAAGQARAQSASVADEVDSAANALLDQAERSVDDTSGRPASLDDWTKADLYDRAKELDIDGRSAMDKDDLVAAIRAANR